MAESDDMVGDAGVIKEVQELVGGVVSSETVVQRMISSSAVEEEPPACE